MKAIPEDNGNSSEEETERLKALEKFRDCVADRWVAVRNIAKHSHAVQFEQLVQSTKTILAGFVSTYGGDLHFAPLGDSAVPLQPPPEIEGNAAGEDEGNTSTSGKVSSAGTSVSMLEHEYRYVKIAKTGAVWTCFLVFHSNSSYHFVWLGAFGMKLK